MKEIIDLYSIESHYGKNGNFCLLDWLIASQHLEYSDYDKWRNGEFEFLDSGIKLNSDELELLINSVETNCRRLKLSGLPKVYYQWNTDGGIQLFASRNRDIHKSLTQSWARARDVPQLDIFLDNSDVGTENDLRGALENRNFQQAREKLRELARINSAHPRLGVYQDLVNYGSHMEGNPLTPDASEDFLALMREEISGLETEVEPLAQEVLGAQARDYLAFAWQRLANGLRDVPFNPESPQLHQTRALEKIPNWSAVKEILNNEPGLFEQPVLLRRWAFAHRQLGENNFYLLGWCHLFERHLDWVMQIVEDRDEPELYDLWEQFHDNEEEMDPAWFAGFILLKHRGLIHLLAGFPVFSHPATLAVVDLLITMLEKRDEKEARQKLQRVSRPLLSIYLNSR